MSKDRDCTMSRPLKPYAFMTERADLMNVCVFESLPTKFEKML
jgi:hypothetical protein